MVAVVVVVMLRRMADEKEKETADANVDSEAMRNAANDRGRLADGHHRRLDRASSFYYPPLRRVGLRIGGLYSRPRPSSVSHRPGRRTHTHFSFVVHHLHRPSSVCHRHCRRRCRIRCRRRDDFAACLAPPSILGAPGTRPRPRRRAIRGLLRCVQVGGR